ncbi:hypothetical protein LTR66_016031 [Elasticomyces elasticus]|nr:hypothetical protein LTR66_016031 [Elasticomyces elasticus]
MCFQPEAVLKTPYIVDDNCRISESEISYRHDYYGSGQLAQAELAAYQLSMLGYNKSQDPYVYDYATTRQDQAPDYAAFSQPAYASHYASPLDQVPSGLPNAAEIPLLTAPHYPSRDAHYYAHQQTDYPPFIDAESRHLPEIISVSPTQSPRGDRLLVDIRSVQDLTAPPAPNFAIMFGSKRCDSVVMPSGSEGQPYRYRLSTSIPPFETTGSHEAHVPLYLEMNDGAMPSMGPASVEIGSFAYSDPDQYQTPSSPHKVPRKRKLETDGSDNHRSPAKRPSMQQFPSQAGEQSLAYPTRATTTTTAHASPFYQSAMPESYDYQRGYSYQQSQEYEQSGPRQQSYMMTPSAGASHLTKPGLQSQTSTHSTYVQHNHSPPVSSGPTSSMVRTTSAPASVANPPLIRTSTLQPSPPTTTRSAGIAHGFGSYATMYPSNAKASLKIEGELGSMAEHWTHDEFEARRRLVQFRRSQAGSIITTSFEAVTPEERSPNSICISCIWWEQKQEAFVTSVDTIYLLESLVAVRFTVEEKNRIRRNLEGFRPLTVSKAKPESEEFFKTIMGFPNPKPRNIEKDVKVFPWRILAHALKKIIGKYVSTCTHKNPLSHLQFH